jgi:lipoprotein-releasing system permease protein
LNYRLFIALRYLWSRRRISLVSIITGISVAGITLGVAALIIVLSVMNGFYGVVRDMLVSFNPHVRIVALEDRGIPDYRELISQIRETEGIASLTPYVEGKVLLAHEGRSATNKVVILRGVDVDPLAKHGLLTDRVVYGETGLERRENRPGIILGQSLGTRLGLFPGGELEETNTVSVLSAAGMERMLTRGIGFPAYSLFSVRGLYSISSAFDENYVFVALPEAQRLFRLGDRATGIDVRLTNLEEAAQIKTQIEERLDRSRFEVLTWYDLQRSLYEVMRLEKWGASAVLALIVLVAAFNLVGSLTMVVIEKRRDLGVLRALGVSAKGVRQIFLMEGLLVATAGSSIGLALGLGVAGLQQRYGLVKLLRSESFIIDAYPISIQPLDIVIIVAIVFVLCSLASLYPAMRAASIDPAQAVRNE